MARTIVVFVVVLLFILIWPDALLVLLTPLTGFISDLTCPFLDSMRLMVDGRVIHVTGDIHIGMVLADGSPLPAIPGQWQKHGQQTFNILLVALSVWAMPPMSWPRRLLGLPVVLAGCLIVSGFDLAVQIQESALSMMGTQWLSGLPLASTPENLKVFADLESWYEKVKWIKGIHDAGGRLFLSVLAGAMGFFLAGAAEGGSSKEKSPSD